MAIYKLTAEQQDYIKKNCLHPNFPKPGVQFFDIFPFLERFHTEKLHVDEPIILLPEARGFLFYRDFPSDKVIPLRKANKLPGQTLAISTKKEYGEDIFYLSKDALRRHIIRYVKTHPYATIIPVMFFDDIAATGQTAESVIKFFNNLVFEGYHFIVTRCRFFFELEQLEARKRIEDLNVSFETYYSISL